MKVGSIRRLEVIDLPNELAPHQLVNRAVVVFDVLRATTSMLTALAAGASRIIAFASIDDARAARRNSRDALLCGERFTVKPDDFDLGNSPAGFTSERCAGRTLLMCTSNGTRAIVAAGDAQSLLIGALANRSAVARHLRDSAGDITLLCSGSDGQVSIEDQLGAGAVIDAMDDSIELTSHARDCVQQFRVHRHELPAILRTTLGGQNICRAGLDPDIDFAAVVDRFDHVGLVHPTTPPTITRA